MGTGAQVWSETAGNNATSDSNVNWAEGMAPSQVNDSARAEMASFAKWRDDNSGALVTGGTTTAFTITSNQVSTGNTNGYTIAARFNATADTSATLNVDGQGAAPIQMVAGSNLLGQEIQAGETWRFQYSSTGTAWLALAGGYVQTNSLSTNAVTYSKLQQENINTLLGAITTTTSTAVNVGEIAIGTGLQVSGTSLTAPQFPPTASFKNLSIKVTGSSTASVAADFVTVATSGSSAFQTLAYPSGGIDFLNSGNANQIDTGSFTGNNTWYAIWAIATPSGTVGRLASLSFTSPTMPSSFTYKARIGAVVTSTSTSSVSLMGTLQFGRDASYIVGLAGTTAYPIMAIGTAGNVNTPSYASVSTTNFIPSTAEIIRIKLGGFTVNDRILVDPTNATTSGANNIVNPALIDFQAPANSSTSFPADILLNGSNIFWASNGSSDKLYSVGWRDNI